MSIEMISSMNSVLAGVEVELFKYEAENLRIEQAEAEVKGWAIARCRGYATALVDEISGVIARTQPTVLPMTWTNVESRAWRLWNTSQELGLARPTVTLNRKMVSWWATDICRIQDSRFPRDVTRATSTIFVTSEPSWQTWRRWSTVIIDDFFKAMREVRNEYGIEWNDRSKVESQYSWDTLSLKYASKAPFKTFMIPLPFPVREPYADEDTTHSKYEMRLEFCLTIPNPPEGEKDNNACHTVEEEVTETRTRKVRRMKCA